MKRVICFCRVSSKVQDLETQREVVLETIKKDGFKDSEVVIVEGKESAIKLDEQQRETIKEMKQVVKDNPSITDIYFYAIDRLARKVSIVLSIVDQMTVLGINLHFLNPYPMQTMRDGKEDAMGKMFLTFLSIGAEMEMKMKNERFADTRKGMRMEGKLVTGKVLYGYYRDANGFPQIKEDEAEVVKYIFNKYENGESMRNIAKTLVTEGRFDNSKLSSALTKVSHIISNPAYSGRQAKQYDSKEEKLIKYPQIVSVEQQDRCLAISPKKRIKDTTNIYYAKGIVKIKDGEKLYAMSPLKGNASYCYKNDDNKQINVSINVIDGIIWENCKQYYKIHKSYERFFEPDEKEKEIEALKKKIEDIQPILERIDERKRRISKMYKLGRIEDDEYDKEWNEVTKEESTYQNEVMNYQNQIERKKNQTKDFNRFKEEDIDLDVLSDAERFELCKTYISEMIVEKVGKYDYLIYITQTEMLKVGVASYTYYYNCSGGKKRLVAKLGDKALDCNSIILNRYKAPKR